MSIHELKYTEERHQKNLTTCLSLFQPKRGPVSKLDPRSHAVKHTETLANATLVLLSKHSKLVHLLDDTPAAPQNLKAWLQDPELLAGYNTLLTGSVKLLFQSNIPLYQIGPKSEFTRTVLQVYTRLRQLMSVGDVTNSQLAAMLHAFEYHFKTNWNGVHCSTLKFDGVRDLLSHSHDLVCPPLFSMDQVVKRDYFRLSLQKLQLDGVLVEVFQLGNGELAIFNVNCQALPFTAEAARTLLRELAEGNDGLLRIGRSLLFPTLRKGDLLLVRDTGHCLELATKTGNGVVLQLTPIDQTQWEAHWRLCLRRLFGSSTSEPSSAVAVASAHLAKAAHPYQNFKLKHDRLCGLRPEGSVGLAVELQRDERPGATAQLAECQRDKTSMLHKSKPLCVPLSSELFDKSPSLEDIQDLHYDKLLELDRSISMDESRRSLVLDTPTQEQCKTMRHTSSVERLSPVLGEYIEDGESIISQERVTSGTTTGDTTEENGSKHEKVFDLSAELHKPMLARRRSSSSLLSLFSSNRSKTSLRNKKGLVLDTSSSRNVSDSSSLPTPSTGGIPTPTSATSLASPPQIPRYCELPADVDLDSSFSIFRHDVRVSHWGGTAWTLLAKDWLSLDIRHSQTQNSALLVVSEGETGKYKMCLRISPRWKTNRSTAQDVQLRVPQEDCASSVLKESTLLSIRCPQVTRLMNVLWHCINNDLPSMTHASSTPSAALSAASSTMSLAKNVSRSATDATDLSLILKEGLDGAKNLQSLLLLSNIRARLHKRDLEHGWKLCNAGKLDVSSQECDGCVVGVKFELACENSSIGLVSRLDAVKRIGRTGISLVDATGHYLLELQNQLIADQVYKLVSCLA